MFSLSPAFRKSLKMNEKRMVPLQVKMHTVDPRAFVRRDQGWFWEVQTALLSPVEAPVNTPPKNFFVESGSQILRMYFHYIRETTGAGVREAKEAPLGPSGSSLSMFLLSWHKEWLPGPHGPLPVPCPRHFFLWRTQLMHILFPTASSQSQNHFSY